MINRLQDLTDTKRAKYRTLMFAPAFAPFANPEAIVNSKLALAMLNEGWETDVISRKLADISDYDYGTAWNEPWIPLKEHTYEISYDLGNRVRRVTEWLLSSIRIGHPIEGCRWATHALDLAFRLHKQNHYDIILSRSLPDFGHLPALAFSKKTGLPWIANWNDAFGDKNPPPVGKGANANLGLFHGRFLKEVAKKTSWVTFPSERMRRHICKYLGNGTSEKSSTIPHVALKSFKKPRREKKDSFTVCYAGNLYPGRNPESFFCGVIDFLKANRLPTKFKLFMVGLENLELRRLVESFGLESYAEFKGPLSYMDTLNCCDDCDVLLVIEAPYEEGIYLPSKFVDYVQTGRPILAVSPPNGTLRDIISMHGGGVAADCKSSEEICNALNELYFHWEQNTLDNVYGSDRLYHLFSAETIINSYEGILKNMGIAPS
jgi:glycosyltransferase involved in cell wall biosynthesis